MKLPVSHHLKSLSTYSVNDLGTFIRIGNLEFLLEKYGRLLVRGFNNARDKEVIWWRRGRVQEREEVDGLESRISKTLLVDVAEKSSSVPHFPARYFASPEEKPIQPSEECWVLPRRVQ